MLCLTPNTTYYLRAYATYLTGTGYGNEIVFTTLPSLSDSVTDIDGNIYHTVNIGNQTWMIENLRCTHYRNGDAIPNIEDNSQWNNQITGGWCYYNNNVANNQSYGKIYNSYTIADSRQISPVGWHIPTVEDINVLFNYLGGSNLAGDELKDCNHFDGTNSSGFTGIAAGFRQFDGQFGFAGFNGSWYTSQLESFTLEINSNVVQIYGGSFSNYAYSLRCIRD